MCRMLSFLAALLAVSVAALTLAAGETGGAPQPQLTTATFAGGCFWCLETPFDNLDGLASVPVGYPGGRKPNPTYQQVSAGSTGHAEAVEIKYDPAKIDYAKLLDVFWHNIDPLTPNAQFCDHGSQYRSAIFYQ